MTNKKELLEEMGYKKKKVEKPKKEKIQKTKLSKNNPSVNKNSQFWGDFK